MTTYLATPFMWSANGSPAAPSSTAVWQFGNDLTFVALSGEVVGEYVPLLTEALGPSLQAFGITKKERVDPRAGLPIRNELAAWAGAGSSSAAVASPVSGWSPKRWMPSSSHFDSAMRLRRPDGPA